MRNLLKLFISIWLGLYVGFDDCATHIITHSSTQHIYMLYACVSKRISHGHFAKHWMYVADGALSWKPGQQFDCKCFSLFGLNVMWKFKFYIRWLVWAMSVSVCCDVKKVRCSRANKCSNPLYIKRQTKNAIHLRRALVSTFSALLIATKHEIVWLFIAIKFRTRKYLICFR